MKMRRREEKQKDNIQLYENRELSWLKFNMRVLEEAQSRAVPLGERLTFLSIFQSNLDEFFMVRVGALEDQKLLPYEIRDNKTKMTVKEQLKAIYSGVETLNTIKDNTYKKMILEMKKQGIHMADFKMLSKGEQAYLEKYFMKEIVPLLSPMIVGRKQPFPFLKSGDIYALAVLETRSEKQKLGIIPCGGSVFPRLIPIPSAPNTFLLSEEVILQFLSKIYKGYKVTERTLLRVTRNADIDMDKVYDEDLDYRDHMEEVLKQRKKLAPVRLEITGGISSETLQRFCEYADLSKAYVYVSKSPLELSFLRQLRALFRGNEAMFYTHRVPQQSPGLNRTEPLIPQVLKQDVLLAYPYESIRPFLQLLSEAARDSGVVSIRMTLYRLAKNSKVIESLIEAAENGKQVDVLVELKARFDEANNIEWSRRLEEAGCHVVYGVDGLKVHSKLCLITRKEGNEIQYITQIGTGNYNENTAHAYTDLSLMTARQEIGEEVLHVFQAILLGYVVEDCGHLLVAPRCLQNKILAMIEEEIVCAKKGEPAYIGIKINSLTDKKIINKLIEASRAGVQTDMIIRGINCLRSGIAGKTDHIHVVSIVGRFLEHSRIYIFGTGKKERIYISSADFMTRNTLRRIEVAAPVYDQSLKERIRKMFQIMLADTAKGRIQQPDGSYCLPKAEGEAFDSQEYFYEEAYRAVKNGPSS